MPTAPYKVDWTARQGSRFSKDVLDFLHAYWKHDVVLSEWPVVGTRMRYDFVNLTRKIIIESDGVQHGSYNPHFHNGIRDKFKDQIKRDLEKEDIARVNGFTLVRIMPSDLPLTREFFKTKFNITL